MRVSGPLFSVGAHGTISKVLTFSKRKQGQKARKYNKPTGTPSPKQRGIRRVTEFLVAHWQNMSDAVKDEWRDRAAEQGYKRTGYMQFLKEAQADLLGVHGLCGYWPLNEKSVNKTLDFSGNENTIILKPGPAPDFPVFVKSKNIKFGNGLQFDGATHYGIFPYSPSLLPALQGITLEAWIYPTTPIGEIEQIIFLRGSVCTLRIESTLRVRAAIGIGDVWFGVSTYSAVIELEKWYHILLTYNDGSNRLKLYTNGVRTQSTVVTADMNQNTTPGTIGGRSALDFQYAGIIDEVCLYRRAMSEAEVLARYRMGNNKVKI